MRVRGDFIGTAIKMNTSNVTLPGVHRNGLPDCARLGQDTKRPIRPDSQQHPVQEGMT